MIKLNPRYRITTVIFLIFNIMNLKTNVRGFINTSLVGPLGVGAWSSVRIRLASDIVMIGVS